MLCAASAEVHVVELDEAVLDAATRGHHVSIRRVSLPCLAQYDAAAQLPAQLPTELPTTVSACDAPGGLTISVTVADAAACIGALPVASLSCVLLDAYDAKGHVPAHLQAAEFVRSLGAVVALGGSVVANLWNGTPAARASADAFVGLLELAGFCAFGLRVLGHEKNRILVAIKLGGPDERADRAETRHAALTALRARIGDMAEGFEKAWSEPNLLATMRDNARTLAAWQG